MLCNVPYNKFHKKQSKVCQGRPPQRKQANKRYFIFAPHLTNASALPGKTRKHENRIYSLNCCINALPDFNQSLLDFCNLDDSQIMVIILHNFLNVASNEVQLRVVGFIAQEKGSRKFRSTAAELCCAHNAPVRSLAERLL